MQRKIKFGELAQAQLTLLIAIALQFLAARISNSLLPAGHYLIIGVELALVFIIGLLGCHQKSSC
jgi:hypothetical protein